MSLKEQISNEENLNKQLMKSLILKKNVIQKYNIKFNR